MNDIVHKRTDLINFFFNEDKIYTTEEVLNKEFAVLSFSPKEEYIDHLHSPFDDLCVDLSTYEIVDTEEMFLKGIIVDIDRQNFQTIIHVQNKDAVVSISCSGATLNRYNDYLIVGEPILAKCKAFNERLYLSLLMCINDIDNFKKEYKYLRHELHKTVDTIMEDRQNNKTHYGLIIECKLTKTRKGRDMVIGTLYDGNRNRSFGTVKTSFNPVLPVDAMAGDFVKFNKPTKEFFLSNMEVVKL